MKQCLICHKMLKWMKFKCLEGYVCKECYEIVSESFSQTITQNTKSELVEIYNQRTAVHMSKEFETTRSIFQVILFDDKRQKICLPNHPKYTRTSLEPEFYDNNELVDYRVNVTKYPRKINKKTQIVGTIEILLTLKKDFSRSIWLIPNPIKVDSVTYKMMESLANKIIDELDIFMKKY